jgi:hypothetical protein
MTSSVYFGFDSPADVDRARQVRAAWLAQPGREAAGCFDPLLRQQATGRGDVAIKRLIGEQLRGSSVVAVLIGAATIDQRWVKREIDVALSWGSRMIGIYIHRMPDANGREVPRAPNPLTEHSWWHAGSTVSLAQVPTYDWVLDDGPDNLAHWVDVAPPPTRP